MPSGALPNDNELAGSSGLAHRAARGDEPCPPREWWLLAPGSAPGHRPVEMEPVRCRRSVLAFRRGVDQAFLDHLCDMRLSFEPHAARLAAAAANREDKVILFEHAEACGRRAATRSSRTDLRFHRAARRIEEPVHAFGQEPHRAAWSPRSRWDRRRTIPLRRSTSAAASADRRGYRRRGRRGHGGRGRGGDPGKPPGSPNVSSGCRE